MTEKKPEVLDEVKARSQELIETFGNVTEFCKLFTEDCVFMPTGSDAVIGNKYLKELQEQRVQRGVTAQTLHYDEIGPEDATDTVFQRNHYITYFSDGRISVPGKHVLLWKKVGGKWLVHLDIFNTSVKPGQSTEAGTGSFIYKVGELLKRDVGLATAQGLMEEIQAAEQHYMEAWSQQNKGGVASCYTTDAKIMASEMDVIQGRNDIADYVGSWFAKGMTSINLEAQEVGLMGASGGMAYEWGYSTLSNKTRTVQIPGKFVILWKKVDGQWQLYTDIFNKNGDS